MKVIALNAPIICFYSSLLVYKNVHKRCFKMIKIRNVKSASIVVHNVVKLYRFWCNPQNWGYKQRDIQLAY